MTLGHAPIGEGRHYGVVDCTSRQWLMILELDDFAIRHACHYPIGQHALAVPLEIGGSRLLLAHVDDFAVNHVVTHLSLPFCWCIPLAFCDCRDRAALLHVL